MAYKKGQDRRQRVLFPDCIDEYVEADAPVRLFDAFVDNLKMNELGFVRSTPAETSTPGYDPRDLLKKGKRVKVEGFFKSETYHKDGKDHHVIKLIATSLSEVEKQKKEEAA